MEEHPRQYFSYLLRVWQAENDERGIWRASLEDSRTGKVVVFKDLQRMSIFLSKITGGTNRLNTEKNNG